MPISQTEGYFWKSLELFFRETYPASIHLDEGILQETSSRRLHQDDCICLSHASSEDLFKASWSRQIYLFWSFIFKTSSRRIQDLLLGHLQEHSKTSSRRLASSRHLQNISNTYHQVKLFLLMRLQNVYQTHSTRSWEVLQRQLSTERFA